MFYKPICRLIAIIAVVLLAGCATTNNYAKFYKPRDITKLPDLEYLKENQEPQVMQAPMRTMKQTIKQIIGKGYFPIGVSLFNGELQDESFAKAQAQQVKAVLVLVANEYLNTKTSTVPLLVPNNHTTYGSGTINHGSYSGSSTTYGSAIVPITTQHHRYDQIAIYYVKSTKQNRIGLIITDLTPEIRKALGRNTGALVFVVVDESPAFYANVLEDDVLIEFEDKPIRSALEAQTILLSADRNADHATIKVLRNGAEKTIAIKF
jgi:serine protease Do